MLTAEGSVFSLNAPYDTSGLSGALTAQIDWGDGTTSSATVRNSPSESRLKIRFDYSLDSSGFFNSQTRRNLLQTAADAITTKLTDTLAAISVPSGNTWRASFQNPSTGQTINYNNLTINANELLVYVGARDIPGGTIAFASRGGTGGSFASQSVLDNVRSRGQSGALKSPATDFGPWGGSLAFDSSIKWHFGATTAGLDSDEFDFITVAQHEIMHLLGFGTSPSFDALLVNGNFTGSNTQRVAGVQPIPMANTDHFSGNLTVDGRPALMGQGLRVGTRDLPTRLDFAALQDLGWSVSNQQINLTATHTYGDNGNQQGVVRIKGAKYGELTYPLSVTTTNVAPTLTKPAAITQVVGAAITVPRLGVFTDPGYGMSQATPPTSETFTYSINWGDGTPLVRGNATVSQVGSAGKPTQGYFPGEHTYSTPGTYQVVVRVSDDDGGSAEQTFNVTITGIPVLTLQASKTSLREDAGANAATLEISRSGFPINEALRVTLTSSLPAKLTVPTTITIPAGATKATVAVQVLDNNILDGSVQVSVTASANGVTSEALYFDILDHEKLILSADRVSFAENAGAGAVTLTVRRPNTDISQPLQVQLRSSDTTELTVPNSVTIPAGQASVQVGVNAVDDNLFDGSQLATISATASGYESTDLTFEITDHQPIRLAIPPQVVLHEEDENRNSTELTISIKSPAPAGGAIIQLISSPPGQLNHPASVIIPAGQTSTTARIELNDDIAPQGERVIRITGSGPGLISTTYDIPATDVDEAIWSNLDNLFDIDGDGRLSPLDALEIINNINRLGTRRLDPVKDVDAVFIDPDRDGWVTPLDALLVINEINRRGVHPS